MILFIINITIIQNSTPIEIGKQPEINDQNSQSLYKNIEVIPTKKLVVNISTRNNTLKILKCTSKVDSETLAKPASTHGITFTQAGIIILLMAINVSINLTILYIAIRKNYTKDINKRHPHTESISDNTYKTNIDFLETLYVFKNELETSV